MHKNELASEAKENGYSNKRFLKLAFIVEDLGPSQIAAILVNQSNKALYDSIGFNISLFFVEQIPPCVDPMFARYHVADLVDFDGYVVATSVKTAKEMMSAKRAKKCFYITDIVQVMNNLKDKALIDILEDTNILKITRSKDYFDKLRELGYHINTNIIKDFDIPKFLEIAKS